MRDTAGKTRGVARGQHVRDETACTSMPTTNYSTESEIHGAGHAAVRDLALSAPIHGAAPDGSLLGTVTE